MFLCVETFIDKKGRNRLLDQTSLAGHLAQGHDSLNRLNLQKKAEMGITIQTVLANLG